MEKSEVVREIAKRVELDVAKAELVVDAVIAEIVSPHLLLPGGEVAFLDNHCTNNCKEPIAEALAAMSPRQ